MNFNLLKIVATLFLIWTYKTYSDMGTSDGPSENFVHIDKMPNVINNRLLAKYELHYKGGQKGLTGVLSQNMTYNQKKDETSGVLTFEQLSKRSSNNSGIYKKPYRQKHLKKKGLSKLDQKFEKKIFDKMDLMYELAKNRKNKKKSLNKVIFNKFGIKIILFGLLPIIGLIFPILFDGSGSEPGILNWCTKSNCGDTHTTRVWIHDTKEAFRAIEGLNLIFFYGSLITWIFMIIYTFIKVIKYVGLKSGKENMRAKEYFHLCKELFSNE
ncbi:Protein of unknown function, putative [Plasmodium vivax]|nr:Protein of unknown function, putative [Plasmodium vivax]